MSSGADRSRERAVTVGAAAALTASAVLFTLMASGTGDYAPVSSHIPSTTDDAAPRSPRSCMGTSRGSPTISRPSG